MLRISRHGLLSLLLSTTSVVSPLSAATFTVDSTSDVSDNNAGDGVCNDGGGNCTLRAAIEEANALSGADNIHFNIAGGGPHAFVPGSAFPTISETVVIDGTTEPDFSTSPVIELNGLSAGAGVDGLKIEAANCTVRGLVINRFTNSGIWINGASASGNSIEGNFIGTDVNGTADLGNGGIGVVLFGPGNTVGGTTVAARNIISGNESSGMRIQSAVTTGNVIIGNYIGTDFTGNVDLGNTVEGIAILDANNTIGGTATGAGNVVSGNGTSGIRFISGSTGNVVQGNYIGTNAAGTADLGNTNYGIWVDGSTNNTIGGTSSGAGNLISGNDFYGISISNSSSITVEGNLVGTDAAGTASVPNSPAGIQLSATTTTTSCTIGGTSAGARNVISGNSGIGLNLRDAGTTGTIVQGNYIGVAIDGTTALPNTNEGVKISTSTTGHTIGGTVAGAGNVISANAASGIAILSTGTDNNVIQGNFIGTDASGTLNLGNTLAGVEFSSGSPNNNTIGGTVVGAGNTIAYNGTDGVQLFVIGGTGNAVEGNSIHSNGNLGIDLAGVIGVDLNDAGDADTGANNLQNFPVLTGPAPGGTNATGTLNSTASTTFRIEFFASTSCESDGYGEGETYLDFTNVTTDGGGNANINYTLSTPLPSGKFVTATATDPSNNTSEFSLCGPIPTISSISPLSGKVGDSVTITAPTLVRRQQVTRCGLVVERRR